MIHRVHTRRISIDCVDLTSSLIDEVGKDRPPLFFSLSFFFLLAEGSHRRTSSLSFRSCFFLPFESTSSNRGNRVNAHDNDHDFVQWKRSRPIFLPARRSAFYRYWLPELANWQLRGGGGLDVMEHFMYKVFTIVPEFSFLNSYNEFFLSNRPSRLSCNIVHLVLSIHCFFPFFYFNYLICT